MHQRLAGNRHSQRECSPRSVTETDTPILALPTPIQSAAGQYQQYGEQKPCELPLWLRHIMDVRRILQWRRRTEVSLPGQKIDTVQSIHDINVGDRLCPESEIVDVDMIVLVEITDHPICENGQAILSGLQVRPFKLIISGTSTHHIDVASWRSQADDSCWHAGKRTETTGKRCPLFVQHGNDSGQFTGRHFSNEQGARA